MKARIRHIICTFVAFAALGLHAYAQAPQKKFVPSARNAESAVTSERLRSGVEFLSDTLWHGRGTGSRGAVEAAFWIERQFRAWGLVPFGNSYVRSFRASGGRVGHNVVGLLHGTGSHSAGKGYIIVGAHYDNIGVLGGKIYPGADSNASGVVSMTMLARMFHTMVSLGKDYGRSVIFVAFDAKELSMGGSDAFARMLVRGELKDPRTGRTLGKGDIFMMVNIDQIGSSLAPLKSGRKDYMLMLCGRNTHLSSTMNACNSRTGLDLAYDYYGSRDFTKVFYEKINDQRAFLERGIPSVLLTSGITMLNNKVSDDAGTLDYPVLQKRVVLIFNWLSRFV